MFAHGQVLQTGVLHIGTDGNSLMVRGHCGGCVASSRMWREPVKFINRMVTKSFDDGPGICYS